MYIVRDENRQNVMTRVGFEPTPMKTTALTLRLRPLGHRVVLLAFIDVSTFIIISQLARKCFFIIRDKIMDRSEVRMMMHLYSIYSICNVQLQVGV